MTQVWVLSEESPFNDPEASGGCVYGVFASAAAALFDLGTWEIGPEALAEITWHAWHEGAYEGRGYGDAVYILRRYDVQEEASLRTFLSDYEREHALQSHPLLTFSTVDLLALLGA